jgi:hypothetical protein
MNYQRQFNQRLKKNLTVARVKMETVKMVLLIYLHQIVSYINKVLQ